LSGRFGFLSCAISSVRGNRPFASVAPLEIVPKAGKHRLEGRILMTHRCRNFRIR